MLGTIIEAVKCAIDLRKKAREDRKIGLEIQKLEREKKDCEGLIERATLDDVKKYDPKFKRLRDRIDRHGPVSRDINSMMWIFVAFLLVLVLLFGFRGSLLEMIRKILGK